MRTEVVGEDMEGTAIEAMIAHLATRLGITDDSDDESEGDINVASEEIKVNPFDGKQEGGAA